MWWSTVGVLVSLTCTLLAAPLPVAAPPAHVPRLGVLAMEGGLVATPARFQAEFREALRERGYVEGQTLRVDSRWVAAGHTDRLHDLAAALVRLPVDLLVAVSTPAAQAAKRATRAIPWAAAWSRASRDPAGMSRGSRGSGQRSGASASNSSGNSSPP